MITITIKIKNLICRHPPSGHATLSASNTLEQSAFNLTHWLARFSSFSKAVAPEAVREPCCRDPAAAGPLIKEIAQSRRDEAYAGVVRFTACPVLSLRSERGVAGSVTHLDARQSKCRML